MWAIALKEFRQLRRDRRTLAMMIVLPFVLLIVFGYAASFDVKSIRTGVFGPEASCSGRPGARGSGAFFSRGGVRSRGSS